jgi:hypothetical protein
MFEGQVLLLVVGYGLFLLQLSRELSVKLNKLDVMT